MTYIKIDNYLCHHGIKGQAWGVRNGPPYPLSKQKGDKFSKAVKNVRDGLDRDVPDVQDEPINYNKVKQRGRLSAEETAMCVKIAKDIYKDAKKWEPEVTKDLFNIVNQNGSKMHGLKHRLKQPDSLAAKIGQDAKEKGVPFNLAAKSVNDVVRYTVVSDNDNFTGNYNTIKNALNKKGYKEIKCKNYWDSYRKGKVLHKAVQSVYETRHGNRFELQFQTPESQSAKELKVPIYEQRRKSGLSKSRKRNLENQMRMLAEQVPTPKDIYSIRSY